ncbi:hypothetical protein C7S13_3794 [Burkholderia cepacia]|nr:hypothetical protein [Burkholderia cepacia]
MESSDESSKRAIMRTDAHLPVSRNRFDRLTPAERFHDESARNREIKRSRYASLIIRRARASHAWQRVVSERQAGRAMLLTAAMARRAV